MGLLRYVLATTLWCTGLVSGVSQDAAHPLVAAKQGSHLTPQSPAHWANMSMQFQQFSERDLFGRQETCLDVGYSLCPDGIHCCPTGDVCTADGCCDAGEQQCASSNCYNPSTSVCCPDGSNCPLGEDCMGNLLCCPAGKILCGSDSCYNPKTQVCCPGGTYAGSCDLPEQCCADDGCYNPETHRCCGNQGSCPLEDSCCEYECCKSSGYCGDNGYCEANTCTVTSTSTIASYYRITEWVTQLIEPEEEQAAPEFVCPPLTVTNNASATLELGDDCLLTLYPPPTDTTTTPSVTPAPSLKPRANAANCLITSTSIVLYTMHLLTTVTTTITMTATPDGFSCPPMTVTNVVGDELSLDEECILAFSPGPSDSTPSSTSSASDSSSTGTAGGGGTALGGARRISSGCGTLLGLPLLLATFMCLA